MAELKIGTTVGGNIVFHAGNVGDGMGDIDTDSVYINGQYLLYSPSANEFHMRDVDSSTTFLKYYSSSNIVRFTGEVQFANGGNYRIDPYGNGVLKKLVIEDVDSDNVIDIRETDGTSRFSIGANADTSSGIINSSHSLVYITDTDNNSSDAAHIFGTDGTSDTYSEIGRFDNNGLELRKAPADTGSDSKVRIGLGDGGTLRIYTNYGWTDIGAKNSSYTHFESQSDKMYFGDDIIVGKMIKGYPDQEHRIDLDPTTDSIYIYPGDTSSDAYFVLYSSSSDNSNPRFYPSSANSGYVGSGTTQWRYGFFEYLYDGNGTVGSFDEHDDLGIIDSMKLWKDKNGKPYRDDKGIPMYHRDSIPDFLKEGKNKKFIRPTQLASFSIGAIRQLHKKVKNQNKEILELQELVFDLKEKINKLLNHRSN